MNSPPGGVLVPPVPAGEVGDICVELIAPSIPGRYVGYWRLITPSTRINPGGVRFGQRLWIDIAVSDAADNVSDSKNNRSINSVDAKGNSIDNNENGIRVTAVPPISNGTTSVLPPISLSETPSANKTTEDVLEEAALEQAVQELTEGTNAALVAGEVEGPEERVDVADDPFKKWSLQLQQLSEMDFLDCERNISLLELEDGDVAKVVERLLLD